MNYFTEEIPGRKLTSNRKEYLWFGGTSYLGISRHPQFKRNFTEAVNRYGISWGSSRNNTVQLKIYEKAEAELADFAKMPAAITVSSGMLAGQLAVNFLKSKGNSFWIAPKTHPALWSDMAHFSREDYGKWASSICSKIKRSRMENIVVCSDAVGSPYVEEFDFNWISELPADREITVLIDASHSLGINLPEILKDNIRLIITSSLNKAMGMPGGVILSDKIILSEMRESSMFSGSSPMMPALLDAFVNSVEIFKAQRQKLLDNIRYFNKSTDGNTALASIENYPVYCTPCSDLHYFLKKHGIMTACFPYPNATDTPITRLAISALHSRGDLEKLASAIDSWYKDNL